MRAMQDINMLSLLPLQTAMVLFKMKIMPILTYGLHLTWSYLPERNLVTPEAVKAIY
jgi:hypothetical protein